MRRSSIRIVLAILAVAVGVGLAAALVFRPWEANRAPAPIIGVAHGTEILIAPDVNGRMTPFRVAAGQAVRKGDTLAILSNPDLAAAVEEAKADLATARANEANVLAGVRQEEIDTGAQNVQIADANLAFVQTPQDYRDYEGSTYLTACYDAYRYFFATAMPSRNERNSIIFAGTMGLLRRSLLGSIDGWDEWCITEDADTSLRLLRAGYSGLFLGKSFGRGIMPLTFSSLKS